MTPRTAHAHLLMTLLCGGLSCAQAVADMVWLNNGDVLSGEVLSLHEGVLSFSTHYSDDLTIPWRFVRSLDCEERLWVTLIGEEKPTLRSISGDDDSVTLSDSEDSHNFATVWAIAAIHQNQPVLADSWQMTGRFNASLNAQTGNEDDMLLGVDGRINIDDQWNKNAIYWDVDIENEEGINTAEWIVGYSYSRYLNQHWYVQSNVDVDVDTEDELRNRTALGGTVGYRFWEDANRLLKTSAGLSPFWEEFQTTGLQQDYALTWIFNFRTQLFEGWSYFLDSRAYFRLVESSLLLNVVQGVKATINDNISWNIAYHSDYDSHPSDQKEPLDGELRMGIGFVW